MYFNFKKTVIKDNMKRHSQCQHITGLNVFLIDNNQHVADVDGFWLVGNKGLCINKNWYLENELPIQKYYKIYNIVNSGSDFIDT